MENYLMGEIQKLRSRVDLLEAENDFLKTRIYEEIEKMWERININKNTHIFDMEFVNKQIDCLADKLNINLDECDLHVKDIDLSTNN